MSASSNPAGWRSFALGAACRRAAAFPKQPLENCADALQAGSAVVGDERGEIVLINARVAVVAHPNRGKRFQLHIGEHVELIVIWSRPA